MKITPETITTDFLVRIHDTALAAVQQIRQISLLADSGEIDPAEACKRLHEALAPLQVEPGKPDFSHCPVRYFAAKDRSCFWRFSIGEGSSRNLYQDEWFTSIYTLDQCIAADDMEEIPASEGEP
jgi:hypothetical protein